MRKEMMVTTTNFTTKKKVGMMLRRSAIMKKEILRSFSTNKPEMLCLDSCLKDGLAFLINGEKENGKPQSKAIFLTLPGTVENLIMRVEKTALCKMRRNSGMM